MEGGRGDRAAFRLAQARRESPVALWWTAGTIAVLSAINPILNPAGFSGTDVLHLAVVAEEGTAPDGLATVEYEEVVALAQVNHYYTRSFEEYEAKRVGGSATGRHERQALPFDIPTLATDRTAMRFVARTVASMASIRCA